MSTWQAIILGITQGLTEFLPVSSSGHLQIVPWLAQWDDFNGQDDLKRAFDVALHLGTLVGVVACLRREVWTLARDGIRAVFRRDSSMTAEGRLGWLLVLSAVPAGVVGVALGSVIDAADDEIWLTGVTLVVFGLFLWWADQRKGSSSSKGMADVGVREIVLLGVAQACALQPGVSRSGVTITAGRMLAFNREAAVRLAMLMSIPVIAGAGLYSFIDIGGLGGIPANARAGFAWGTAVSAVTGFAAVRGLLALARTRSFGLLVVYRVLLGLLVLSLIIFSVRP